MAGGSLAARWTTQVCIPPAGGETGNETAEHLHPVAQAGHWPLLVGVLGALTLVGLGAQIVAVVSRRPLRTFPASRFFWLPPLAFLVQELSERARGAETFGGLLSWQLALGLALQLPFALLATLSARLLVRVAERLGKQLATRALTLGRANLSLPSTPRRAELPRIPALATGYGERGPPLPG